MSVVTGSMKVGFFGQSGPYSPVALRELLTRAGHPESGFEVALVVEGRRRPVGRRTRRWRRPARRAAPARALPGGQSLPELTEAARIPLFETCDVNCPRSVREIASVPVDVLVCAGFDRLFGAGVLGVAGRAALNAHPSALPRLRGPAPIFWALREGARDLTVTVHGLDREEDHGPVFAQAAFGIPPLAAGPEIYGLAGQVAGELLGETLTRLSRGTAKAVPQNHALATRAPRPRPEDARVFPEEWRCVDLVNFSSAAPYFRAPWLVLGGETFHLRRGLGAEVGRRLPGEYVLRGAELMVVCRDGVARLEVQV